MPITDKELLAICNLSNLKMEFANLKKEETKKETTDKNEDLSAEKILSNHTIYSLIKNELEGIEKRKEKKNNYDSQLFPRIKESSKNYTVEISNQEVQKIQAQLTKEYIEEISKDEVGNLGSFYSKNKNNNNTFIYSNKIDLQKEAPIIMEYYDRYQHGNEEGKFLDEWEVVYGGDFYEILLDYFILTKSNFEKKEDNTNEGMSIITSPTKKYKFKTDEKFIFREDIIFKKNFSHSVNFAFDLLSVVLPARELREFVFVNTNYTRTPLLKKLFFLSKPLSKTVETKTIIENANNTNIIEKFVELCCHKDNKKEIFGELNVNISLDIVDIKIVIVKKKSSNDFIVAFKSSDSNEIIKNLNKGVLSLDLLTFNALIENVISNYVKDSEANVYFTGYGDGATLATACFLTSNSIPNIEKMNESSNNSDTNAKFKINYYNRSFVGTKKLAFLELISFNAYDIEYVTPGSFSYTLNLNEDVKNFFDSLLNNMRLTDNIGLITAILLKRSIFTGVFSAFASVGLSVTATLIIIYFVYSWLNRKRLENLESKFKKNEIILKITDNYNKINEKLFKYASIVDSYSKIHLIPENKFEYDNSPLFETQIHMYINNFFKNIEEEKNKNNKINKEEKNEDNKPNKEKKNEENDPNKERKNEIELIEFKLNENKTIFVPFIVAIKLIFSDILHFERFSLRENYIFTNFYFKNTIIFGKNYNELYILKLDEDNKFVGIVKIFYEQLSHPISSKYYYVKSPTFSFEKMVVLSLNTIFTAQEKYDENSDEITNSKFIYLKGNLNKEDELFIKEMNDGVYQNTSYMTTLIENKQEDDENKKDKENKEKDEKNNIRRELNPNLLAEKSLEKTMVIQKKTITEEKIVYEPTITRKYLILSNKTPTVTEKLSEVQGFPTFPNINFPASEYIYFPYLGVDGMITSNINDNFVGTLMRSILRYEIKYETLEVNQEDAEFESYEFYGTIKGKNKELDDYFLQQIELHGHKYCSWIHYNSVMNLLKGKSYKERLKFIEKFYNIKVEDERIKKGNLKVGILDKEGNYSKKDIGYIYNQDKLSGRAIDVPYYYGYKEDLEGIDTYGVCDNAILECSCGSKPNILIVTSQKVEYSNGELDATEEDKTTPGFIECSNKKGGCTPKLKNWTGVSEGIEIEGKKCLLSTSKISCETGGIISILNPNCIIKSK